MTSSYSYTGWFFESLSFYVACTKADCDTNIVFAMILEFYFEFGESRVMQQLSTPADRYYY